MIAYLMAYVRAYKGDVMLCRTERPMAEKSKIVNSLREKKVLRETKEKKRKEEKEGLTRGTSCSASRRG